MLHAHFYHVCILHAHEHLKAVERVACLIWYYFYFGILSILEFHLFFLLLEFNCFYSSCCYISVKSSLQLYARMRAHTYVCSHLCTYTCAIKNGTESPNCLGIIVLVIFQRTSFWTDASSSSSLTFVKELMYLNTTSSTQFASSEDWMVLAGSWQNWSKLFRNLICYLCCES